MMFYEDPRIMYENPPPPSGYEFDFESDPIFFTYSRPQRIIGVNYLKIDHNLIHKDLIGYEEKEQNSTNTVRGVESANGEENAKNTRIVTTGELNAQASMNKNTSEEGIDTNKASKKKVGENEGLAKIKIKCEVLKNEGKLKEKDHSKEAKKTESDSDKSTSKKKSVQYTTTPALESISKSYSRKSVSNSDSDSEMRKKSKSSSHPEKSKSNKSSGHRKVDKHSRKNITHGDVVPYDKVGLRSTEFSVKQEVISSDDDSLNSTFSKKAEISVKEETLSDKDDNEGDKRKSSKSSRKKHRRDPRNRLDDDCPRGKYREDSRKKHYDGSSSDDSRKKYSDDDSRSKYSEDSQDKSSVKKEIKQESGNSACYKPTDLYCDVCKLILNSETTYSSHMAGKRHKKALRLKNEQDVAKSQILDIEGHSKKPAYRHSTPWEQAYPPEFKESQSCPRAPDVDRIQLYDEESKIQGVCDDTNLLIIGLDYVQEIRGYEETKYYCDLCSAQCVANSIVNHLIGFKHQISCVKIFCPKTYDWIKDLDKRDKRVDREIKRKLEDAMLKYGRGRIKVYKDKKKAQSFNVPFDPYQPSTSRQDLDAPIKKADELAGLIVTDEDCLSRDFSDFYCKVCDSHMNNHSMWESHARGKRHAKNKKKAPEGLVSDGNYIEAPYGTISHLEDMIHEECGPNDILVGLNFIKENQGENGDLYNCFLCGSVCPTMDIIDHLYLRKHKIKYLEKMLHNGYVNAINEISVMPIGDFAKDGLVDEECDKMLQQVGRGRPVIAIAKKTF